EAPHLQDRPPDFNIGHSDTIFTKAYNLDTDHALGARPCNLSMNHAPMRRHAVIEHNPGPPNVLINTITIETANDNEFEEIMSQQELKEYVDQKMLTEVRATENLRNSRNANKVYYDRYKQLRTETQQLHVGDHVLVHCTKDSYSHS